MILRKFKSVYRHCCEIRLLRPKKISFLKSRQYIDFMSRCPSEVAATELNEAELKTSSYMYRHSEESRKKFGVFRWRGIFQNRLLLYSLLKQSSSIIDLGGAASPLGCGSKVLDLLPVDCLGRAVPFQNFNQIPFESIDHVFSSHALEHIPDLETVLLDIQKCLVQRGTFFFHLPAYTCTRWRSGIHTSNAYNDHHHDFYLSSDKSALNAGLKNPIEIDSYVENYFKVLGAWYCGDNSIIIYGAKK